MTGRALYDRWCDAVARHRGRRWESSINAWVTWPEETPLAWPFLGSAERRAWNNTAENLVTRRGASRAK